MPGFSGRFSTIPFKYSAISDFVFMLMVYSLYGFTEALVVWIKEKKQYASLPKPARRSCCMDESKGRLLLPSGLCLHSCSCCIDEGKVGISAFVMDLPLGCSCCIDESKEERRE